MKSHKGNFNRVMIIGTLLVLSTLSFTVWSEQKTTLRMATYYGTELDHITKKLMSFVKQESNGSLRLQVFRGGELIETDQLYDAVSKGTIDIVHGVPVYWAGKTETAALRTGMPGAWTSIEEAKDLFQNQGLADIARREYSERGVQYITTGWGSDYDLLTKNPVSALDDLKALKVRATPQVAEVLKSFDIPTVNLPSQELYVAMSTGVIDGVIYGGALDYVSLKLIEVGTHYTVLNLQNPGWTEDYLANQKKWDSLSSENKALLTRAMEQMAQDISDWYEKGNKQHIDKFNLTTLSDEDSKRLVKAAQGVWDKEAARSESAAKAVEILRSNATSKGRLE